MDWNRKELKKRGMQAFRAHYFRCIIVSIILTAVAGGLSFARPLEFSQNIQQLDYTGATHTEIVNEMARGIFEQNEILWQQFGHYNKANAGALASIFNNATASGSFIFGLLNAMNQLFFKDGVLPSIIIAIGAILSFLYYVFVSNVIKVGETRFYLENRRFCETKVYHILFVFKIRRVRKVALVMFLRALYTVLWFFTIIGGFIKLYSYRLVPYIVAENPSIGARDAILLSRRLMYGQKWKYFLLDLSFIGWYLLSMASFGLLEIFFLGPYHKTTCTELYMQLRENALARQPALANFLNDHPLDQPKSVDAEYPIERLCPSDKQSFHWLSVDYHRHYTILNLVLLFFIFCFIGYAWEVLYYLITTGTFINRGTMYGPWLPIYGVGGALVLLLLHRFVDRPVLTFFLVIVLCGSVEYFTSWFLEVFKGTKWWDYTGYFLNINGRVCLEGLLVFGFAGTLGIYLMGPVLDNQLNRIPKKWRIVIALVLVAAFLTDFVISYQHPNMTAGVAAKTAFLQQMNKL